MTTRDEWDKIYDSYYYFGYFTKFETEPTKAQVKASIKRLQKDCRKLDQSEYEEAVHELRELREMLGKVK